MKFNDPGLCPSRDITEHNEKLRRMRWRYHFGFLALFVVLMFALAIRVVTHG